MKTLRKWLRRLSMPDLGHLNEGDMVLIDGQPHRTVYAKRFPGSEHSKFDASFIPWPLS